MFMNRVRYKYVLYTLLVLFLISLCYSLFGLSVMADLYPLKIMGGLGIVQLVISIVSWKKIQGTYFNPYILFISAFYLFTFGQSFLIPFELVTYKRDLLNLFSVDQIFEAQYVTLLFLNFFQIGALLAVEKKVYYTIPNREQDIVSRLKKTGWFLLCLSIIPYINKLVNTIQIVTTLGYGGLYMQEQQVGTDSIDSVISNFFLPSIILLYYVYANRGKWIKQCFYLIFLLFVLYTLFVGGRSMAVVLIAILLILYHYLEHRITGKTIAILAVLGYFFVSTLSVIAHSRGETEKSLDKYIQTFQEISVENSPFFETISEMGWSMFPLIQTMNLVPDQYSYRYGSTYLYAASSIVPNFDFWDLHPAMKYANLGDWLVKVLGLTYGPGYSLIAEAYVNFGIFGFIVLFIHGFLLARLFSFVNDNCLKYRPLIFFLAILFAYLTIPTVRNSFLGTVRVLVYFLLLIYVMVKYLFRTNQLKYGSGFRL